MSRYSLGPEICVSDIKRSTKATVQSTQALNQTVRGFDILREETLYGLKTMVFAMPR
jgi:hypothetical protein